ncbi:1,2-phenylacetyl-CoA epoxidase subunit PaaE [Zhengella mangrovi]|nr:1,2-phenylacetyl-CoA epoxidase subunit PaaE [Zhengella mangrovi]
MARFHDLTVARIDRETPDAVSIAFDIPDDLKTRFAFKPGQYLTLAADIGGEEIRRSYSICSGPGEPLLRVGIRRVEDGRFTGFVTEKLSAGDIIRVMEPEGRFTPEIGGDHDYLLVAAGSGITPMLAIAKAVLSHEPGSRVTLVYGNRETGSIMFLEEVEDLKDRYLGRFSLIHVLSRESQDVDALNGRIDGERIRLFASRGLIDPENHDLAFLCGPGAMIDAVAGTLKDLGMPEGRIRYERFTLDGEAPKARPASSAAREAAEKGAAVEVIHDGVRKRFHVTEPDQTVLDAAHKAGHELPWSCSNGMCCTCRCKVVDGTSEMALNFSLEPWEVEAGYTLACQTRPTSEKLVLDFDAV